MDKKYWEAYYKTHRDFRAPSRFSEFVWSEFLNKMRDFRAQDSKIHESSSRDSYLSARDAQDSKSAPDSRAQIHLLELGCGNGRDSFYFAQNGARVSAIDQASEEIAYLQARAKSLKGANLEFIAGDFTNLAAFNFPQFECIYSRFTLHSIDKIKQDALLEDCLHLLKNGGFLCIEARGEKNNLFGKGEAVPSEKSAFIYDSHYRRFLNFQNTLVEISQLGGGRSHESDPKNEKLPQNARNSLPKNLQSDGENSHAPSQIVRFKILFSKEARGFAPYKDEDDFFIRIIAQKTTI